MRLKVWISGELAGSGKGYGGGYVDHEANAVLMRQNENSSLLIMCLTDEYEIGKTTLYGPGQWLAVEDVELPSKEVRAKVDQLKLW